MLRRRPLQPAFPIPDHVPQSTRTAHLRRILRPLFRRIEIVRRDAKYTFDDRPPEKRNQDADICGSGGPQDLALGSIAPPHSCVRQQRFPTPRQTRLERVEHAI